MEEKRYIPLSALQHYAFCPRQCALIHIEGIWADNGLTAQGNLLHEKVDSCEPETRKGIRYERGVSVSAKKLGLTGKLDLLEIHIATGEYKPIEYKRGKPKINNCDRVQLCAQALCLEEMLQIKITEAALWYGQTRHREVIKLNSLLRDETIAVINEVKLLFKNLLTPIVKYSKKCNSCSLYDSCNPKLTGYDRSPQYRDLLFREEDLN